MANPAQIQKNGRYKQGIYVPEYPEKYAGKHGEKISYRSMWEKRVMVWFDRNPNVLFWNSEGVVVPYISPLDGKQHRYFVDFIIKVKTKTGEIKTYGIEVKPSSQCAPPTTKNKKRLVEETATYAVNKAKWEYAKEFFESRGAAFMVITEKDIGIA